MIEVPQAAIDLAKRFEGFCRVPKSDPDRAYPYVCPAGFWTIGYGHLCDAKHPPITMEEGEAYLAADMADALRATLRYCPVLATEPEGRLAAIVDVTFNLGAGRLQTSTLEHLKGGLRFVEKIKKKMKKLFQNTTDCLTKRDDVSKYDPGGSGVCYLVISSSTILFQNSLFSLLE